MSLAPSRISGVLLTGRRDRAEEVGAFVGVGVGGTGCVGVGAGRVGVGEGRTGVDCGLADGLASGDASGVAGVAGGVAGVASSLTPESAGGVACSACGSGEGLPGEGLATARGEATGVAGVATGEGATGVPVIAGAGTRVRDDGSLPPPDMRPMTAPTATAAISASATIMTLVRCIAPP